MDTTNQELLYEEITPEDSVIPVYLIPLTEDEILERKMWVDEQETWKSAEEAKIAAKESALSKLAESSGLTQEELSALLG